MYYTVNVPQLANEEFCLRLPYAKQLVEIKFNGEAKVQLIKSQAGDVTHIVVYSNDTILSGPVNTDKASFESIPLDRLFDVDLGSECTVNTSRLVNVADLVKFNMSSMSQKDKCLCTLKPQTNELVFADLGGKSVQSVELTNAVGLKDESFMINITKLMDVLKTITTAEAKLSFGEPDVPGRTFIRFNYGQDAGLVTIEPTESM